MFQEHVSGRSGPSANADAEHDVDRRQVEHYDQQELAGHDIPGITGPAKQHRCNQDYDDDAHAATRPR